ncbi:T9SS type A sorting domain-containing protein [Marivirga salinae]|uniref:T9SS type A sorting domain-containing protein n=1 Tax=Marivirga salinarum TaxID=3059078 RepID=A0AA51NA23_9BACT|nr:T9SS type A sorting domain-containing protein [Marivirga sp. BDSF4-3]WMN11572.1 T9SS type A sorting domain-containing protein [Marivirga sp. BDSF4-3]
MKTLINILILTFFSFNIFISEAGTENPIVKTDNVEIIKALNNAEVYPNPAEEYIYLRIDDKDLSSDVKIEVMSIIGNKMKVTHDKLDTGLYKIDLSNIPVGHYYVMLTVDSEKSLKKFIKK